MKKFIQLDVECYPNRIMIGLLNTKGQHIIIDGVEDIRKKFAPIYHNKVNMWVNFNGFNYDLPLIEYILNGGNDPYKESQRIINDNDSKPSFIKNSIDLLIMLPRIARCSLKEMGHRLGYRALENLPYPYDKELTNEQWAHVCRYNLHDLNITKMLWDKLIPEYESRVALGETYGFHALWSGAAGLSKKVFKLNHVSMGHDMIYPKGMSDNINHHPLCKHVYQIACGKRAYIDEQYLHNKEAVDKALSKGRKEPLIWENLQLYTKKTILITVCGRKQNLNGVDFDLSVGGFHSKPKPGVYNDIYEYDFSSLYPNICIENNIGGESFNSILSNLLNTRMGHKKAGRKAKSDAYKLLINSVTGCFKDTYAKDSVYSLYSSLSMLLAGQFNMLDLIARLPHGMVILSNTDSIWCTQRLPQSFMDDVFDRTGLTLEEDHYDKAIIKDVNSVCCIKDGKIVKRKKEFLEPVYTHNVKAPIIQRCVLNYILHGIPVSTTLSEGNPMDFMFFTKGNRNTTITLDGEEFKDQRLRFYVSKDGITLHRHSRATGIYTSLVADSNITTCMDIDGYDTTNLNTEWYTDRANKLLDKLCVTTH